MSLPKSNHLRDYSSVPFEIFIAAVSILPFLVLAYYYPMLPDRVPLFMKLNGEVAEWAQKSVMAVFRVPLMAIVMQIVCLLMKYGTIQSYAVAPLEAESEAAKLVGQSLDINSNLWDWFRWAIAFKMSAECVDTIFLGFDLRFLARASFVVTVVASLIGVAGALFYAYRLLLVNREIKEKLGNLKPGRPADRRHVYGGLLYFNPSDPVLFSGRYIFNFANKWAWVYIACIIAYPLLVFLPG